MFKAIPLYAKNLESGESHEICGGGILSGGKYYYEYYKKNEYSTTRWLRPKAQHTAFAVLFATVPPFKRMVLLVRPWMPPPDCDRGVENKD